MLETLSSADFAPFINQLFPVLLETDTGETLMLELTEVRDLGAPPAPGFRPPFSLIFGHRYNLLPQRMYPLDHPSLGRIEILLVPVGPGRLQAIFA